MGIVADKYIQPQRLLGYCHLLAGAAMIGLFGMGQASQTPNEAMFIAVYTFSVAFYMPTLALSNTSAFSILKSNGLDTVKAFPPIRVFGTVGFILTMWIVNCATWDNGSFSFLLSETPISSSIPIISSWYRVCSAFFSSSIASHCQPVLS